jgi:hypothetical protein
LHQLGFLPSIDLEDSSADDHPLVLTHSSVQNYDQAQTSQSIELELVELELVELKQSALTFPLPE